MSTSLTVLPFSKVIEIIDGFIRTNSYTYFEWYIGLAADPEKKLIEDHRLDPERDTWTCHEVSDERVALLIKEYFLERGCVGGISDIVSESRYIYLYRKSYKSNP